MTPAAGRPVARGGVVVPGRRVARGEGFPPRCGVRRFLGLAALLASLGACAAPAPSHRRADGTLGPYSGSVRLGDTVHLSGKIGPRGGTFAEEARGALDAVEAELAALGLTLADLVSVTVYLTDMSHGSEFNRIYGARLPEPWPARACVAVAGLPGGARVEIQGIANGGAQR